MRKLFSFPFRGRMTTRKAWLLSSLFAAGFFLAGSRDARAQERGFALDKFDPSTRGSEWFSNDSLDLRGKVRPAFGLVLDYAYRPLTFNNAPPNSDIIAASVVRNQLFMHAGGSVVLFDRLRLEGNLPIALENYGHGLHVGVVNFNEPQHEQGVGDLSFGADFRLLGKYGDPFTMALGAEVFLPTGSRDDYTSDGQVRFKPRLLAAGDIGAFVYAARFDFQYRGLDDDYGSIKLGSELGGGVSLGVRTLDKHLVLGPELSASTILSPTPANPNTGLGGDSASAAATYVEGLLGAHLSVSDFRFGVGGGVGMTRGYGTPAARGLLSVEWVPQVNEDKDGDGIKDDEDACPSVPGIRTGDPQTNGCPPPPPPPPDSDGDDVIDSQDACPQVPGVKSDDPKKNGCPPDKDGDGIVDSQDACVDVPGVKTDDPKTNGCPPDTDGDGIIDAQDACPKEVGIKSDDPKLNGCPDPDRDKDGVTNDVDACPDEPGKPDPDPKKNGCPIAYVKDGEIKITQQVRFKSGSARIVAGPDSEGVLNAVDEILLKHPDITKVRVEGHTDNVGGAAANKTLSKNRAQSVVTWLVKHGVEKTRLYSVGFGQEKPIADNATEDGKAQNRRVEFHIEEEGTAGSGNNDVPSDAKAPLPTSTPPGGHAPTQTPPKP